MTSLGRTWKVRLRADCWRPDEDAVALKLWPDMKAISDKTGRTLQAIYRRANEYLGLRLPRSQKWWTDAQTEHATGLWKAGFSASEIAGKTNRTRNAVIGRLNRLGLLGDGTQNRQSRERKSQQAKCQRRIKALKPSWRDLPAQDFPPTPVTELVALLDLKHHHCRFPIGEVGHANFGFCGRTNHGFVYCATHMGIAYRAG